MRKYSLCFCFTRLFLKTQQQQIQKNDLLNLAAWKLGDKSFYCQKKNFDRRTKGLAATKQRLYPFPWKKKWTVPLIAFLPSHYSYSGAAFNSLSSQTKSVAWNSLCRADVLNHVLTPSVPCLNVWRRLRGNETHENCIAFVFAGLGSSVQAACCGRLLRTEAENSKNLLCCCCCCSTGKLISGKLLFSDGSFSWWTVFKSKCSAADIVAILLPKSEFSKILLRGKKKSKIFIIVQIFS